jgi:hypothetical protein
MGAYCKPARDFEPFVRNMGLGEILDYLAETLGKDPSVIIYQLRGGFGSKEQDMVEARTLWNLASDEYFIRQDDMSFQLEVGGLLADCLWTDTVKYGDWYERVKSLAEIYDQVMSLLRVGLSPAQFSILEFWVIHHPIYGLDYELAEPELQLFRAAVKNINKFLGGKIKEILF